LYAASPKFEAGTEANPFPILEWLWPHVVHKGSLDRHSIWLRSRFGSVHEPVKLRSARKQPLCPTVKIAYVGCLPVCFAAVSDRKGDCGANHDVEDALISIDARPFTAPDIPAQIYDLDSIKPLTQHLAQTSIGPAGQELAVGYECDDASFWCVLGLE
jgi:hypothetical protein